MSAIARALAALAHASHGDALTEWELDLWREHVVEARNEHDRQRARIRELEEENAHFRSAAMGDLADILDEGDDMLAEVARLRAKVDELAAALLNREGGS